MKRGIIALLFSFFFFSSAFAIVGQYVPADAVLDYASKKLPSCGAVEQTADGFVYLKISDRYTKDLLPRLMALLPPQDASQLIPPYSTPRSIGPHVPIIYPQELKAPIRSMPEKGRQACFTITGLYYADMDSGPYARIYFLTVASTDLQKIRINYGLQPLYKNNDFRIAIAVSPRKIE